MGSGYASRNQISTLSDNKHKLEPKSKQRLDAQKQAGALQIDQKSLEATVLIRKQQGYCI